MIIKVYQTNQELEFKDITHTRSAQDKNEMALGWHTKVRGVGDRFIYNCPDGHFYVIPRMYVDTFVNRNAHFITILCTGGSPYVPNSLTQFTGDGRQEVIHKAFKGMTWHIAKILVENMIERSEDFDFEYIDDLTEKMVKAIEDIPQWMKLDALEGLTGQLGFTYINANVEVY